MRAALYGDAVAQCYLGIMYEKGMGAPMDRHKAAKWYRHAAEQGYPDAQASLEILYGVIAERCYTINWHKKASGKLKGRVNTARAAC